VPVCRWNLLSPKKPLLARCAPPFLLLGSQGLCSWLRSKSLCTDRTITVGTGLSRHGVVVEWRPSMWLLTQMCLFRLAFSSRSEFSFSWDLLCSFQLQCSTKPTLIRGTSSMVICLGTSQGASLCQSLFSTSIERNCSKFSVVAVDVQDWRSTWTPMDNAGDKPI